jgi:hypothetical protein
LSPRRPQDDDRQKNDEIADEGPLQRAIRHTGREQGADATADGKTYRQPDQPADRDVMAALTIVAYAGQAGGHHLCDQGDTLGDVLVLAEDQHQKRHQNAAAGDAEEAGRNAPTPPASRPPSTSLKIIGKPPCRAIQSIKGYI